MASNFFRFWPILDSALHFRKSGVFGRKAVFGVGWTLGRFGGFGRFRRFKGFRRFRRFRRFMRLIILLCDLDGPPSQFVFFLVVLQLVDVIVVEVPAFDFALEVLDLLRDPP